MDLHLSGSTNLSVPTSQNDRTVAVLKMRLDEKQPVFLALDMQRFGAPALVITTSFIIPVSAQGYLPHQPPSAL